MKMELANLEVVLSMKRRLVKLTKLSLALGLVLIFSEIMSSEISTAEGLSNKANSSQDEAGDANMFGSLPSCEEACYANFDGVDRLICLLSCNLPPPPEPGPEPCPIKSYK